MMIGIVLILIIIIAYLIIIVINLKTEINYFKSDNEKLEKLIDENLKFFNSDEIIKDCECYSSEESINYKGVNINE